MFSLLISSCSFRINCLFRSLLFSKPRRENGGEDEDALLCTLSTELEEIVTVADKDLEDPDSDAEYCEKEVSDDECDSDVGCHSGDSDEKQQYLSSHVDTSGDVVEHMSSSVSEQSSEDWPSIWTSWWESSPWNSATGMLSSALRETASRDQEGLLRARSTAAIRIRDWNRQIDRDSVSTGISNELPDTIARTTKDSLSSTLSIRRMKNFRHSKSSIVVANSRRSLLSVPNAIPSSSLEVQGKLSSNLEL